MIGQHPALFGFPELVLFDQERLGDLAESMPPEWLELDSKVVHRSPGLIRAVSELEFGGQTSESLSDALDWVRERADWSGAEVLDHLMAAVAPRVAVEKSPENVNTSAALQRLMHAYPRARYLHLTRHPVSTIASMVRHWGSIAPRYPQEALPMFCTGVWYFTHLRVWWLTRTLDVDRWLSVRAEDVLRTPTSELERIATWLRISTEGSAVEAMQHPERSVFSGYRSVEGGSVGGFDPQFLQDPMPKAIDKPPSLDLPANWKVDPWLWVAVCLLAQLLGYGADV
jgi:hypothetical protein